MQEWVVGLQGCKSLSLTCLMADITPHVGVKQLPALLAAAEVRTTSKESSNATPDEQLKLTGSGCPAK